MSSNHSRTWRAACEAEGIRYNTFISGLKAANVLLDRKILSDLAITDEGAFRELVALAKSKAKTVAKKAAA